MRIAVVTAVLGAAGGMGHVAEEYAIRLARRGHEVTVFVLAPRGEAKPTELVAANVNVQYLKPWMRYGYAGWVPQLKNVLVGFDMVHLQYPFIGAVRAVLAWRKTTVSGKLVVTYHMDLIGQGIFRPWFALYGRLATPKVLRAADRVIVSSFDYADGSAFSKVFKDIRDKMTEIPFGVDLEMFKPRDPDPGLVNKLGINSQDPVILFIGGLDAAHYFKGVSVLLRAFALLKKHASRVRLVIIGRGNLLKNYQDLAKKLNIFDQVVFADKVSEKEKLNYYAMADVFVLPSTTRSEAFGLVLLEAQASGVPVIASDLPGVRTVLEDQKTGFLVSPNDHVNLMKAVAWVLTHPPLHAAMRQAARARMEARYGWDKVIDQLEEVFRSVVSNP